MKSVGIGCSVSATGFILIAFLGKVNFILSIAILFFNFLSFEFTIVCSFTVWMRSEAERKAAMMSICMPSLNSLSNRVRLLFSWFRKNVWKSNRSYYLEEGRTSWPRIIGIFSHFVSDYSIVYCSEYSTKRNKVVTLSEFQ